MDLKMKVSKITKQFFRTWSQGRFVAFQLVYHANCHLFSTQRSFFNKKMSENSDKCIFCKIACGKETTEIVFKDDDLLVFPDKHPAAPHHYLVIPYKHLPSAKYLRGSDNATLVSHMVSVGRDIAMQRAGCLAEEVRLGFHWPPFTTVAHLHLHALAPQSSMSLLARCMFKQNSYWFVAPETVLDRLGNETTT